MYVLYAYIRVCMHLCVYTCMYIDMHVCIHLCMHVIFKLGFERYGRGNCPTWEGNCPGVNCPGRNCPGGKCPFPVLSHRTDENNSFVPSCKAMTGQTKEPVKRNRRGAGYTQ